MQNVLVDVCLKMFMRLQQTFCYWDELWIMLTKEFLVNRKNEGYSLCIICMSSVTNMNSNFNWDFVENCSRVEDWALQVIWKWPSPMNWSIVILWPVATQHRNWIKTSQSTCLWFDCPNFNVVHLCMLCWIHSCPHENTIDGCDYFSFFRLLFDAVTVRVECDRR